MAEFDLVVGGKGQKQLKAFAGSFICVAQSYGIWVPQLDAQSNKKIDNFAFQRVLSPLSFTRNGIGLLVE